MIVVAIGASLPGPDGAAPAVTCARAATALHGLCGLRLAALSGWWETAPVPPDPAAPWFVNGVARLEGMADPAALLAALHALEDAAGRTRPRPDAPRTLDLDLIDVHGLRRAAPAPVLPHPRAHLRPFVLRPLAEAAPSWCHPALGLGAAALLAGLPDQPMRALGRGGALAPGGGRRYL